MNAMPPAKPHPAALRTSAELASPISAIVRLDEVEVGSPGGGRTVIPLRRDEGGFLLGLAAGEDWVGETALSAAIEALTADDRAAPRIVLDCADGERAERFVAAGIAIREGDRLLAAPALLWQKPDLWLTTQCPAFPELFRMTEGRRHPLRAPKPTGKVYARFIPWLGQTISFRVLDPDADLALFSRWMNDPRVETIWEDGGTLEKHRADLAARTADPHILPLIGALDDAPFGYFEVYWAKENRLGPHYDADDYDRGWHVAIGEDAFRGRGFITAWLPSLMHFMFLDDVRTRRIVGEPRSSHAQQIRNLDRAGFAKVKHFDFPHKRALLVMLLRERFFEDRLFAPEASIEAAAGNPA